MYFDNMSRSSVLNVLALATRTASANSSSVDTQGFGSGHFTAFYGAAGDTLSGTVTIETKLQHSDDNSTWVDCADSDIIVERKNGNTTGLAVGTAAGATTTGVAFRATASSQLTGGISVRVGYIGSKRYVRLVDSRAGTQSSGTASNVVAVLGNPEYNPTVPNAS
jgi:hypothetical protein